jgi:DNA-binding transcriptional ArsR family regulator
MALGAGRARVLETLRTPASTGEIAQKLGVSSGAVSQILSRLAQADLVESHRVGKRVYYHLTRRGEELIVLFERIY